MRNLANVSSFSIFIRHRAMFEFLSSRVVLETAKYTYLQLIASSPTL